MKSTFPLLIFFIFCFAECNKHKKELKADNPYGLPNATQTGANIFACRMNGRNFIAFNDKDHLGATHYSDTLIIGGSPKQSYFQTILFQLNSNVSEGNTYTVNNANVVAKYITDSLCTGLVGNIYQFNALNGSIQLTKFDKSNKIASGKLDLTIPIINCDTLKITDGRFDVHYN